MRYYEVLIADGKYQPDEPLTYESESLLVPGSVVSVMVRGRNVTGFVSAEVPKPSFKTLPVKSLLSDTVLPTHVIELARWLKQYYASSLGDALRQFAPSRTVRRRSEPVLASSYSAVELSVFKPTSEQLAAIKRLSKASSGSYLLHGQTGSGKTYVYGELVSRTLTGGHSAIVLVPEIALTTQVANYMKSVLPGEVIVFHSHLSVAQRKKLWFKILEATEPLLVIGPRSALFTPVQKLGLIIIDEAHEQAYKQDQNPRYQAVRVASQLAKITSSKAVFGSATPNIVDYFLADHKNAVIKMEKPAKLGSLKANVEIVDMKDKSLLSSESFLSRPMLEQIEATLSEDHQALIYLNRRGTARLVMCSSCGWQLLCPNCDTPLVYHADEHKGICHGCGHNSQPPNQCPSCKSPDVIYKSIGTKAVAEALSRLFPNHHLARFDGDNKDGERFEQKYQDVVEGKIDIIVGTQIVSKGLDLPRLGMVGVIMAETSLYLPDYTADERTFQTIYQLIGRIGRGHSDFQARAVIQTYEPDSKSIKSAVNRDWAAFYHEVLDERQKFRFPPYSYILKMTCRRRTPVGAEKACQNYYQKLLSELPKNVQLVGPMPAFYYKHAGNFNWQIVLKSKTRSELETAAAAVPAGWSADLDPTHLL